MISTAPSKNTSVNAAMIATPTPIAAPAVVRPPMSAVIGVLLGAAFTPDVVGRVGEWGIAILGLAGFVAASGLAVVVYFRKVARFDPVTAYFSGMPGGLVEMVIVGEEKGGDARTIALIHSARILLVVMTLPFLVQWVEGVALGARPPAGPSIWDAPLSAEAWILVCGIVGAFLGHVLRLPAKVLLGPMLVSAAVHVTGISDFEPPVEIALAVSPDWAASPTPRAEIADLLAQEGRAREDAAFGFAYREDFAEAAAPLTDADIDRIAAAWSQDGPIDCAGLDLSAAPFNADMAGFQAWAQASTIEPEPDAPHGAATLALSRPVLFDGARRLIVMEQTGHTPIRLSRPPSARVAVVIYAREGEGWTRQAALVLARGG